MLNTVCKTLDLYGYKAAPTKGISNKLLAVHSGLGQYGSNNICYIEGLGSFMHLRAFYTDIPCDDNFHPVTYMEACTKCGICRKNCPTGAISDYQVINAEICLTRLNESKGEFPEWLDTEAHNCLIGCLKCQENCQANKEHIHKYVDTVEFDENETEIILTKCENDPYPESLKTNIDALCMHDIEIIPRNLKALLHI